MQNDSSCIVLDPENEKLKLDPILNQYHRLKHQTKFDPKIAGNSADTMVVAIMLRSVQNTMMVREADGLAVDPPLGDKAQEFAEAMEKWKDDPFHQQIVSAWKAKLLHLAQKPIP